MLGGINTFKEQIPQSMEGDETHTWRGWKRHFHILCSSSPAH